MRFRFAIPVLVLGLLQPLAAMAGNEAVTHVSPADFEDTAFAVESAITDHGLRIEAVNHVGDMLERTKEDVGGEKTIFAHADIYNFCSAKVSRSVMEADPLNLVHCPYRIFVMQVHGSEEVIIGYPKMPEGKMQEVEELLESIVKAALE